MFFPQVKLGDIFGNLEQNVITKTRKGGQKVLQSAK